MSLMRMLGSAIAASLVFSIGAAQTTSPTTPIATPEEGTGAEIYGVGDPDAFASKYRDYVAQVDAARNPNVLTVTMGFVKGAARSFTGISGAYSLDLGTGEYVAVFSGLTSQATYSLYLVDRQDDDPENLTPAPDLRFKLADIKTGEKQTAGRVAGNLNPATLEGAKVDQVILTLVARKEEVIAAGSVNLFQKLLFGGVELVKSDLSRVYAPAKDEKATLNLSDIVPSVEGEITRARIGVSSAAGRVSPFSGPFNGGGVTQSGGGSGQSCNLDELISKGAKLFFEGTFKGNGRTCGSCHPAENNFTIDVPFINSRPLNDPLFVAEFNFALTNLEKPQMMHQFGLILENVDDLSNPINKFVMRSVPHTLGMKVSLAQDATQIAPPFNTTPAEMTGWSGDGAPGAGALHDFATGAVTQHFTKSMNRIQNVDFKLPTATQLDQLAAFQLSLGRTKDFDLTTTTFTDANVQAGSSLFQNGVTPVNPLAGGRCGVCHSNGGANFSAANPPLPPPAVQNPNRNFDTSVEEVPHPGRAIVNFPLDGGFGTLPLNADGSFGNKAFNTPSVIEAADTAPFFHNNVVDTLEGVMDFYTGPQFNDAARPLAARFSFTAQQKTQIVQFMRSINTVQNIDVAKRELDQVLTATTKKEIDMRLQTAFNDVRDGVNVLNQGSLYPAVVLQLTAARNFIAQGQTPGTIAVKKNRAQLALNQLALARATMGTIN